MYTDNQLLEIAGKFDIDGRIDQIKALGPGFINDTMIVSTIAGTSGKAQKYILQRKNHIVFPDVPGMMRNIELVTSHIKKKVAAEGGDPMREVLTIVRRREDSLTDKEKERPASDLYYKDDREISGQCAFSSKVR